MLVHLNLNHITESVKSQVEIVVYIEDTATLAERNELRERLVAHSALAEVRFVSRDEALRRMKEKLGDLVEGYEGSEENPLPDSFELRTHNPEAVGAVAEELARYPAVAKVDYGKATVEGLFQATRAVQLVALALMIGLAVTAVFLIAHVRMTVFIRRREIMIMKYVGATNWFIAGPLSWKACSSGCSGLFCLWPGFTISTGFHWIGFRPT